MFKKLINAIWPATPTIDPLPARVDATPVQSQVHAQSKVDVVVQSPQAEEIKKAVAKNAKPKPAGNKPVVPKTAAEKKKNKKPSK
jgi:translation initiation factor 2 gamma subunit (eIF-2gamma)